MALEGDDLQPAWAAFLRSLAHKDADLKALRELHGQLVKDSGESVSPFFRDLGAVLDDRDAMFATLRNAAAGPANRRNQEISSLADALGDADLAAAELRKVMEGRQGFKEGHMPFGDTSHYGWPLFRSSVPIRIQETADRNEIGRFWRQTGKWGDGCKPVGAGDFECQ